MQSGHIKCVKQARKKSFWHNFCEYVKENHINPLWDRRVRFLNGLPNRLKLVARPSCVIPRTHLKVKY
jgi:hypothetical protein